MTYEQLNQIRKDANAAQADDNDATPPIAAHVLSLLAELDIWHARAADAEEMHVAAREELDARPQLSPD